jgi:hypothetical protein
MSNAAGFGAIIRPEFRENATSADREFHSDRLEEKFSP